MKNKIVYDGRTFTTSDIQSGSIHLAASLPSLRLEANTLTAVVKSDDTTLTDFTRNTPLYYYHGDRLVCITYVQNVDRVGPNKYKFYGTSAIGRLIEQPHAGGIYTGQTAEEVISDICGNIQFEIKTVLRAVKLYGWLPYASPPRRSARDNLAQVLFAIGAAVKTDLDGVLRVEPLWDGISSSAGRDKMYTGPSVDYDGAVTRVIVTEHQYTPGSEEKHLFEGTAQAGDVITFDEPMHSLAATGFSIQASGANWARVSAGTGTLTGKVYIHNTRQVSRDVQQAAALNVKTVEDALLVSLVNSGAVAQRLADYYRCRERVDAAVVYGGELPGDRLAAYHPFEKIGVDACMESADITISGTLKAQEKLLVKYVPPRAENVKYLDTRVVLTGSGQWDPPEGVDEVQYVMFSGAQGGHAGEKGGDSANAKSHTWSITGIISGKVTSRGTVSLWGAGGSGGAGGQGGKGAKLLQGTMRVSHGTPISYSCGLGGSGAVFGALSGMEGGDTTLGVLTTADGEYAGTAGWQDPITQEIFAAAGPSGLPGGNGAGEDPDYTIPDNTPVIGEIVVYKPSTGAYDEDGTYWPGAPTREYSPGVAWYSTPWAGFGDGSGGAQAGYALGPGGVAGVSQSMPSTRGTVSFNASKITGTAVNGITPPAPTAPKKRGLTEGGRGGYGGGGGSAPSWAGVEVNPELFTGTSSTVPGAAGVGGPGGKGGDGGDGMIILFYSDPQNVQNGHLVTSNRKFFFDRLGRIFVV